MFKENQKDSLCPSPDWGRGKRMQKRPINQITDFRIITELHPWHNNYPWVCWLDSGDTGDSKDDHRARNAQKISKWIQAHNIKSSKGNWRWPGNTNFGQLLLVPRKMRGKKHFTGVPGVGVGKGWLGSNQIRPKKQGSATEGGRPWRSQSKHSRAAWECSMSSPD